MSTENKPRVYADGVFIKSRDIPNFGEVLKVSAKVEEFVKFLQANVGPSGWINLDIATRKTVSEKGHTHSCWLDQWEPNQSTQPKPVAKAAPKKANKPAPAADEEEPCPF